MSPEQSMTLSQSAAAEALREILDPEMPVNIVDLGIVERVSVASDAVEVDIIPTFVGCPALDVLAGLIREKLTAAGAANVRVRFLYDPPWSVERISDAGRQGLRKHGVTVPARGTSQSLPGPALVSLTRSGASEQVACPFCGSNSTHMESQFGPTRCRTIRYCSACKNQFEHMKPV